MEPNLKLLLDGETPGSHIEILVWHQVMLNVSPYFRSLLDPTRFAEGDTLARNGKVEVPLPETNAQAMKVICDVFHFRYDDIPTSDITSSMLFEIAVLADKFDCTKPLQPWSDKWMDQGHIHLELKAVENDTEHATALDLCKWIKICQGLGHLEPLDLLTSALVKYHNVDELTQQSSIYFDHLSPSITNMMKETQTRAMADFHAIMLEFVELCEQGDSCRLNSTDDAQNFQQAEWGNYFVPQDGTDTRFHCSSITFGNFVLAARIELGSTWRSLDSWTGTINSTYRHMQQVGTRLTGPAHIASSFSQRGRKSTDRKPHEYCSLSRSFSDRLEGAMRRLDHQIAGGPVTEHVVSASDSSVGA